MIKQYEPVLINNSLKSMANDGNDLSGLATRETILGNLTGQTTRETTLEKYADEHRNTCFATYCVYIFYFFFLSSHCVVMLSKS
jgi:hypothetical protein